MKKKYRLLKKKEFDAVFDNRLRIRTKNLIFYYTSNFNSLKEEVKNIKIGVIVPKKKGKKAVDRNYLKRIIGALNSSYQLENFPKVLSIFLFSNSFYLENKERKVNFQELKKEIERIYSILINKCS